MNMDNSTSSLDFPLLMLNKNEMSMSVADSYEELTTCTRGSVKPGEYYDNLVLVTAQGRMYLVVGAKVLRVKNRLNIANLLLRPFGADIVLADLTVSYVGMADVEELKTDIFSILADTERWDSDGRLSELVSKIEGAESVEEMVAIMYRRCRGLELDGV